MSKLCPSGRSKGYEIRDAEGAGGGATMGGDAHRSPPPAAFWFLFRRGKRNSPKGRNPVRRRAESSHPTDVMVYGQRADLGSAPTAVQAKYSKTGGRAGQETRPYNISGKMQKKRTAGRRPPMQSPAKRVCVGEAERWNEQALPFWAKRGIWNPRRRGAAPTAFLGGVRNGAKNTTPRRPFEKRAWRGLITIKCIMMCDF